MFRKAFISLILVLSAVVVCGQAVFAQGTTATTFGTVEMQGTHAPVAGATVEAYRTDLKQAPYSAKTNKKGEFTFAGLMLGAEYALAVSGPGLSPTVYPGVKAGQERLVITVTAGDGKKLTDAEVRSFSASTKDTSSEMTAEEKKAQAEYEQKVAENAAQRKKAEDTNKIVNEALKAGAAAFDAKNYDLAIAKFDEGYQADPDFEGSAPIMLNNKALALRTRGWTAVQTAKAGGDDAAKAAAAEKAKADFSAALVAFNRSVEILAKAPANDGNATRTRMDALKGIVETYSSIAATGADPSKLGDAIPALDKYLAAETDETRKAPVLLKWSDTMRNAGDMKNSIYGYRKYMEKNPESVDAMAGLGLSLFNEGVSASPENKEEEQEGLNLMQKFVDTAPDTHPLKVSVKEAVDYLKNTAKLAPQKVTPARKRP